jgi:hypothetical protein
LKYHWREVPPADFVALKPSIWSGCLPVLILRLRQPCAFGRSIPFIPNLRQLWHVSQTRAIAQFIPEIYPGNLSRKFIPEIYRGNQCPPRSVALVSVFFATSPTSPADNSAPFGLETKNLDPQYYGTSP